MRRFVKVGLVVAAAVTLAMSAACKKSSSGASTDDDSAGTDDEVDTTGTDEGVDATVTMSGSLALASSDVSGAEGASLTGTWDFYCVTFTEEPKACKIDTTIAGDKATFEKACEQYANAAFGCFVRKDGVTLSTVEFKSSGGSGLNLTGGTTTGSSLVVGAGKLVFDTVFDTATGLAYATIDVEQSSALGSAEDAEVTTLSLTGDWEIACDASASYIEGAKCPAEMAKPFNLYFNEFSGSVSDWPSKAARTACFADETDESKPNFRVVLGTNEYPLDFTSTDGFVASIDAVYAALDDDLSAKILGAAEAASHLEWCDNQQQNAISAENCRLVVLEMVEQKHFNPETGQEETFFMPKWPSTWADVPAAYSGAITGTEQKCSGDPKMGMPMCPPNTKLTDGLGTFTMYVGADNQPAQLACRNTQQPDGAPMIHPAMAGNLADAIAFFQGGGNQNSECSLVESGMYAGLRVGLVDQIRRSTLDLFRGSDGGGPGDDDVCARFEVPDGFTFDQCSADSRLDVCHMLDHFPGEFGLKLSGGKLVAGSEPPMEFVDPGMAAFMCPIAKAAQEANPTPMQPGDKTYVTACRNEFVGVDVIEQARAMSKIQARWRPIGQSLICTLPADDALRVKLETAQAKSCVAQAEYQKMCFEGQCNVSLRCHGSSADGLCYDGDRFAGRIPGRGDVMKVSMLPGNAFTLSNQSTDRWERWDPENQKPIRCLRARSFMINALKADDDHFTGIVSQSETESCEGEGGDEQGSDGASLAGEEESKDGGRSMTMPIRAARQ